MNPYIANTPADVEAMLSTLGAASIDDLFSGIKPGLRPRSFGLPPGRSESEVVDEITARARRNDTDLVLFLGGGYYDHYLPAAVKSLAGRGEFVTAYTPYQPECSQGTLQALYQYQSAICALTGMEIANASLYDGATALYEGVMMAIKITGRRRVVLDEGVHPVCRSILKGYTRHADIDWVEVGSLDGETRKEKVIAAIDDGTAAVVLANPNFFGAFYDYADVAGAAHQRGALAVARVYPVSLGLLKSPAEMGVDIVAGEGQSLGLPLSFGGPSLGFLATRLMYARKLPGRIVGETVDREGRRCFVNTLQAREQHIRRGKATSNICTNAALAAVQALAFLSLLGPQGLRELAGLNHAKALFLAAELRKIKGVRLPQTSFVFNEFVVRLPTESGPVAAKMLAKGIAAGIPLAGYYPSMKNDLLVAVTEKRSREEILHYARGMEEILKPE